eukprot:TRINITY_DN14026_c0_g1_i1.p1 TRINITY_DN14026_c0_g1~~TRINITY_DN14026_c0_g1_i1.p1  ORF type:complete len:750 (+),score=127.22 TRINITY_DN14026_c0_g1_i1:83-2251(+)
MASQVFASTTVADCDIDVVNCRADAYARLVRLDVHLCTLRDTAIRERPGSPASLLRTLRSSADRILWEKVQEPRSRPQHRYMTGGRASPDESRTRLGISPRAMPGGAVGAVRSLRAQQHVQQGRAPQPPGPPTVDDSPRAAAARASTQSPTYMPRALRAKPSAAPLPPPAATAPAEVPPLDLASDPGSTLGQAMFEFPPWNTPRPGSPTPQAPTPRRRLGALCCARFAPTGDRIASGGRDRSIRIWDVRTGASQRPLRGHRGWVLSLAWSPCGRYIASCGDDATIRIWEVVEPVEEKRMLLGHTFPVWSVTYAPKGDVLASASADATVRLWRAESGEELCVLRGHLTAVYTTSFGARGRMLCSAGRDGTAVVWDVPSRRPIARMRGHRMAVWGAAFDRAAERLVTSGADDTVRVWRISDQACLRVFNGPGGGLRRAVFAGVGAHVAACASDGVLIFSTDPPPPADGASAADDASAASQDRDGPAAVLKPPSGSQMRDVDCRGSFVLGAGADGIIRVWSCPSLGDPPAGWIDSPMSPASRVGSPRHVGGHAVQPVRWTGAASWGKETAALPGRKREVPSLAQRLSVHAYARRAGLRQLLRQLRQRVLQERPPTQLDLLRYICRVTEEMLLKIQPPEAEPATVVQDGPQHDAEAGAGSPLPTPMSSCAGSTGGPIGAPPLSGRRGAADAAHVVMGDFWEAFAETTCRREAERALAAQHALPAAL